MTGALHLPANGLVVGADQLVVSGGKVGIGAANPTSELTVAGEILANALSIENENSGYSFYAKDGGDGNHMYSIRDFSIKLFDGSDNHFVTFKNNGNVGIGTTNPSAKLQVAGEIKIGNTSSACDSSTEGQQRYNSTTKKMEYCNGTSWTEFGSGGGGGGITSCPAGWTMIGDAGKTATFCIETNERSWADWHTAQSTCNGINDATHGRAHLCTYKEWRTACERGTGLSNMTNNWEWVADLYSDGCYDGAIVADSGGCDELSDYDFTSTLAFRCCLR